MPTLAEMRALFSYLGAIDHLRPEPEPAITLANGRTGPPRSSFGWAVDLDRKIVGTKVDWNCHNCDEIEPIVKAFDRMTQEGRFKIKVRCPHCKSNAEYRGSVMDQDDIASIDILKIHLTTIEETEI